VALGIAAELAAARLPTDLEQFRSRRDHLHHLLQEGLPELVLNGPIKERLPNTLNVSVPGLAGAAILAGIPELAASTGAACHGPEVKLSHVLAAMGVPPEVGQGALRLTVGRGTTLADVEEAARLVIQQVRSLRG
jgi:cysteine desulfurase